MNTTHNIPMNGRRIPRIQHKRERGVVLMVALIALVALTLAGVALMRSIDTGNLIAGNMAFRQASLQASDIGVEAAYIALPSIVATSKNSNITDQYFAIRTTVDANGVPITRVAPSAASISWTSVPCRNNANATVTCSTQDYQVKYLIDRQCNVQNAGSTTITDYQGYCSVLVGNGAGGSKGAFNPIFSSVDAVYYRVTVQVTGPHNTVVYAQAMITTGNS